MFHTHNLLRLIRNLMATKRSREVESLLANIRDLAFTTDVRKKNGEHRIRAGTYTEPVVRRVRRNAFPWSSPFKKERSMHEPTTKHPRFNYGTLSYEHDDVYVVVCAFVGYGGKLGIDYDAPDAAHVIFEKTKVLIDTDANDDVRGTYTSTLMYYYVPTLDTPLEDMDEEGQDLYHAWCTLTQEWPCKPLKVVDDPTKPLLEVEYLNFEKLDGVEREVAVVDVNYMPHLWTDYRRLSEELGRTVYCRCFKTYEEGG